MSKTPHFDKLAAILFDGAVKVDHIHIEPGAAPNVTAEQRAEALYTSMVRAGLIVDGKLSDPALLADE